MDPREKVSASGVLWTDVIYSDMHRHHEKRTIAKQWVEDFANGLQPSNPPIVGERSRKRA
jgi:tetrahydromethanopterin S-methyltransferase subunit B